MPSRSRVKKHLGDLAELLSANGDAQLAAMVKAAISATESELVHFLTSNELWGGAGSIADQAGMGTGVRTDARRNIERVLVELGEEQLRVSLVNSRTAMWVIAFKEWSRDGI